MEKNLTKPTVVMEVINKYKFKMSKSLGQNFLIDDSIRQKIIAAGEVNGEDIVVEVGPGIGVLTQAAAQNAKKVIAVELDRRLIPILKENMESYNNVSVVNSDILKVDLEEIVAAESSRAEIEKKGFKVLANLPYYITTPIIMRMLEANYPISTMVFMMQKEVAERIVAAPGTKAYGALTVAVQYYTETSLVVKVPKNVFIPKPEVESAVVRFRRRAKPAVTLQDEKLFFKVVKAAFSKRRKTLLNALKGSELNLDREKLDEALKRAQIDPGRRGETLTIEEFAHLTNNINEIL